MNQLVLHEYQEKIIRATERFIVAVSGIRGGKTTVGAVWLLSEIDRLREEGKIGDFLITAPSFRILEQSTLPKFKEFFPEDWGVWKEGKGYFKLNWCRVGTDEPCRIYVRSLDDPDSIEGMEALAAWIDEAGKCKSQAWINVQGRLSVTQGRAILTTTPYNAGWFYADVYKKPEQGDRNYKVVTWGSGENPAFPSEELERARKSLPKAIFERRYEGKFTRLEGLVYPEFDQDFHVVEPFDIPKDWLRFAGLDFGRANPNAITYVAEDPASKIYYVYKEYYRAETLLKDISNNLHSENVAYVLADTQSAQLIAELNQFYGNRNVKPADKTIDVGIQRIGSLLVEGRLKFFRGKTDKLIDEMESYHYATPTDRPMSEKPVAKNNHAVDALRYAFSRPLQGLYSPTNKRNIRRSQGRALALASVDRYTGY